MVIYWIWCWVNDVTKCTKCTDLKEKKEWLQVKKSQMVHDGDSSGGGVGNDWYFNRVWTMAVHVLESGAI